MNKKINQFLTIININNNIALLFSLCIFSILYLPFINIIPYLDGNIDLIRSFDFFNGGFQNYFLLWGSIHPPLKLFITSFLFNYFGVHPYSYNIIGYIFGIIGIIYIHKLSKYIFNNKIANLSAIMLATLPIYISVGIFALTDYLVSVLIFVVLYFYSRKKYLSYGVFASLLVLTKETALLLPIVVIFIDLLYPLKKTKQIFKNVKNIFFKAIYLLLPLITYSFWNIFMKANGQTEWNDWNFSSTASNGSIYTILNNLLTFNFLNQYAYQNWEQLFILNFNWIISSVIILGIFIYLNKNIKIAKQYLISGNQKINTILILILFCVFYIPTVLSFQTYTIPRYALPVLTLLIIGFSWAIFEIFKCINKITKILFSVILMFVIILRLFYSVDPISLNLWGQINILGNNFYALNTHLAGNDGITYNMEYLFVAKNRSNKIRFAINNILSDQCNWIFPDPNNDYKTIKILKLSNIDLGNPCKLNY